MIIVSSSKSKFFSLEKKIKRILSETLKILKKKNSAVSVFLVKDEEIRKLNKQFRRKNKTTNVLSFSETASFPHPELGVPKSAPKLLGEIYLAPDYIRKNKEKVSLLVIHGLLHLFGYTHKGRRDRIEMEKKEQEILQKIQKHVL